jgi:uncharacterized protein YndB with AHSA1/START domain
VRIDRVFSAPPEAVFAAWTDADLLAQWMSPRGHAEVRLDASVGGRLQVVMVDGSMRIEHEGTFLEVLPPRRLRFTWSSPYTGEVPSLVTVELTPVASGTRLVLLHEGLPVEAVTSHGDGWGAMLDRLDGCLGSGDVVSGLTL